MLSSLATHAVRTVEVDNVQSLKRRRLTTTVDANGEGVSEVHDMFESWEQPEPPGKGWVVGLNVPLNSAEKSQTPWQMDFCSAKVEKSESDLSSKLGIVAEPAVLGADNERRLKRMRDLTAPVDASLAGDIRHKSGNNYPIFVIEESNGLPVRKPSPCLEDSSVEPDSKRPLVLKYVAQGETLQEIEVKSWTAFPDHSSESSYGVEIKNNSDSGGASSNAGISAVHACGGETSHEYLSWAQQHSEGWTTSRRKGGFAHLEGLPDYCQFAENVGASYRSAIDRRPAAALHPGFVGDGTKEQCCCVCGNIEDATSSLICDSCEEVYHMTCINARMKVVPQIDDWLCRPCQKKRKMRKEREKQGVREAGVETKDWWREGGVVGEIERDMQRMSNGRRSKVRIGPAYQVEVPVWRGIVDEVDLDDALAGAFPRFGQEVALTCEEKKQEQEHADYNLENNIWPKGWLPATKLPSGFKENWLQCTAQLFPEGQILSDGQSAEDYTVCGKWRRAPLGVESNDQWECSCAVGWDPRHAECFVPQELSTQEIEERMKFVKICQVQESCV